MKRIAGLFAVLSVGLLLTSCSFLGGSDTEPEVEYFVVRVDSVSVPASAASTDTLAVHLYGMIGSNGCYGLERVEAQRTASTLDLKVVGRFVHADACLTVNIPLNAVYKATPPLEGPFEITIHQPDGAVLRRTVAIR